MNLFVKPGKILQGLIQNIGWMELYLEHVYCLIPVRELIWQTRDSSLYSESWAKSGTRTRSTRTSHTLSLQIIKIFVFTICVPLLCSKFVFNIWFLNLCSTLMVNICVQLLCSTFVFNIAVQHFCSTFVFNICVQHLCSTFVFNIFV